MTEAVHYWTLIDFVPALNLGLSFARDTYYYVANLN